MPESFGLNLRFLSQLHLFSCRIAYRTAPLFQIGYNKFPFIISESRSETDLCSNEANSFRQAATVASFMLVPAAGVKLRQGQRSGCALFIQGDIGIIFSVFDTSAEVPDFSICNMGCSLPKEFIDGTGDPCCQTVLTRPTPEDFGQGGCKTRLKDLNGAVGRR